MKMTVSITPRAIEAGEFGAPPAHCGAIAEFRGVVRGEENDRVIKALEYQAYRPMAEREMERLLRELESEFPCEEVGVIHRIGVIPVGETAIYIRVLARHRAEAFGMLASFMDRLKQDVPIWKVRAL